MERPRLRARIASLLAVILPFAGIIAAIVLSWDGRVSVVNVTMLAVGYALTMLGVTMGYHRLFTHRAFATVGPIKFLLGVMGSAAVQGPVIDWAATHRKHHQFTDREGDPHSPEAHADGVWPMLKGIWHSHMGWFFGPGPTKEVLDKYVPDLRADRITRIIDKTFGLWVLVSAIIPAGIGYLASGTLYGAVTGLIWGGLVRVFLVHHVSWSINSVCHLWGRQTFETHDQSRDNAIFGLLAFGEGSHNTHHAFPTSARHGLRWWQPDIAYMTIRALEMVGLAWQVRLPSPERIEAKRQRHGR